MSLYDIEGVTRGKGKDEEGGRPSTNPLKKPRENEHGDVIHLPKGADKSLIPDSENTMFHNVERVEYQTNPDQFTCMNCTEKGSSFTAFNKADKLYYKDDPETLRKVQVAQEVIARDFETDRTVDEFSALDNYTFEEGDQDEQSEETEDGEDDPIDEFTLTPPGQEEEEESEDSSDEDSDDDGIPGLLG